MKIKESFILKEVAGDKVVLAVGKEAVSFSGMMKLNASAVLLFETLKKGAEVSDLIEVLTSTYDVSLEDAKRDVESFIAVLNAKSMFE